MGVVVRVAAALIILSALGYSGAYAKQIQIQISDEPSKVSVANMRRIQHGLDLYKSNKPDSAGEEFSRCSEFSNLTDDCLLKMAWICNEASRNDLTQKMLTFLIERCDKTGKPSEALFNALDWRSFCGAEMDQLDQALSDCRRLLKYDISYKDKIYEREANIYVKQKNFAEALKVYDVLNAQKGLSQQLQFKRATCLQEMGRYADAIDAYGVILKSMSKPGPLSSAEQHFAGYVYVERAKCFDKLGKKELARAERSHAVNMSRSLENDFFPSKPPPAIK